MTAGNSNFGNASNSPKGNLNQALPPAPFRQQSARELISQNWQRERMKKMQRACCSIKFAVSRGKKIGKTIERVSRRLNGKKFKCDPSRRLLLSPKSLRRWFNIWKRAGEVPSAFVLNYFARRSAIPAPVLIGFVKFCSRVPQPTLKAAWLNFSKRLSGQRPKFSLYQIYYSLRAHDFYLLQTKLKLIEKTEGELSRLLFTLISQIQTRARENKMRRHQRGNDFQI